MNKTIQHVIDSNVTITNNVRRDSNALYNPFGKCDWYFRLHSVNSLTTFTSTFFILDQDQKPILNIATMAWLNGNDPAAPSEKLYSIAGQYGTTYCYTVFPIVMIYNLVVGSTDSYPYFLTHKLLLSLPETFYISYTPGATVNNVYADFFITGQ